MTIWLAAVVEPGDGLLADITALGERDRARIQAGLLRDHRVVEVGSVPRASVLDPQALDDFLRHRTRAGSLQRLAQSLDVRRIAEQVHSGVRANRARPPLADLDHEVGMLALG